MPSPTRELGLPWLRPFDSVQRRPGTWVELLRSLEARPFLHSDGLTAKLGLPHHLSPELLAQCQAIVERFDRFYRALIDRFDSRPGLDGEYLFGPLLAPLLEAERGPQEPLPISRFDCVLDERGELKVIELNPNGVCAVHLRTAAYLSRWLARSSLAEDAPAIGRPVRALTEAIERFYRARRGVTSAATVGLIGLPGMYRATRVIAREVFREMGWRSVEGRVEDLVLGEEARLRGVPIDLLWSDSVFYWGYQSARYMQTKFPSKVGDYRSAPEATARLVSSLAFRDLIRSGRLVHLSPVRSYLAISKHLLAWAHREGCPLPESDRAWLAAHVARTYASDERTDGTISVAQAVAQKDALVLKPCQYGGSHGVAIGRDTAPGVWRRQLEESWTDPGWVLQEFHQPCRAADGNWLSFGLYNHGGRLGGVICRSEGALNVSTRTSAYVPIG